MYVYIYIYMCVYICTYVYICVAACCSVLLQRILYSTITQVNTCSSDEHVFVYCCSVLQCVAMRVSALQCVVM